MVFQVGVVHHVVYEARGVGHTRGVSRRVGTVEGQVEVEVGVVALQLAEVVEIEDLVEGAGAIEIVHGTVDAMERAREVHDLGTQGSHAGATADPYHLVAARVVDPGAVVGAAHAELAVGAAHDDLVARIEGENVGGGDAGVDGHKAGTVGLEGRGGDADGEHEDIALVGVVGHGVGAHSGLGVGAMEGEHIVLLPRGQVLRADEVAVEVVVVELELGDAYLGVAAGDEVHVLARRQLHLELLDESGHVAVGDDGALVFLDAEDAGGHGDGDILLHLRLAAEAPPLLYLLAGEEAHLGGEDGTAALEDAALALSAGALAAAGGREVDVLLGEGADEAVARGHGELLVVVYRDGDVALGDELGAQHQQQGHQQ